MIINYPTIRFFFLTLFLTSACLVKGQSVYNFQKGTASFKSEAPLEIISARSEELRGLIDFSAATFAFTIPIQTFKGFNSRLQQEHFNENYMESTDFPKATFAGKVIEKIDVSVPGEHKVRAKGKLNIHGVETERIIQAIVRVTDTNIEVEAEFLVPLVDHNITIPRIVQQKIAETILVNITATARK